MPNFEAHNGGNVLVVKRWYQKRKNVLVLTVGVIGIAASAITYYKWISSRSTPTISPSEVTFESEFDVVHPSVPQDVALHLTKETNIGDEHRIEASSSTTSDINERDRQSLDKLFQSANRQEWEMVLDKSTPTLSFRLDSNKHKKPTIYLSTTFYKNIGDIVKVRDFMIDNEFKIQFDNTYETIEKVNVDTEHKIGYYHVVRNYPFIGYREYFLASKIWQKQDGSAIFCVTKACKRHMNTQTRHKVVDTYLQGWRITKVENGCEVKLYLQEDLKTMLSYFKDKFIGRVWEYVKENDQKLRTYIKDNRKPPSDTLNLIEFF